MQLSNIIHFFNVLLADEAQFVCQLPEQQSFGELDWDYTTLATMFCLHVDYKCKAKLEHAEGRNNASVQQIRSFADSCD